MYISLLMPVLNQSLNRSAGPATLNLTGRADIQRHRTACIHYFFYPCLLRSGFPPESKSINHLGAAGSEMLQELSYVMLGMGIPPPSQQGSPEHAVPHYSRSGSRSETPQEAVQPHRQKACVPVPVVYCQQSKAFDQGVGEAVVRPVHQDRFQDLCFPLPLDCLPLPRPLPLCPPFFGC